jgi:hypothetical protein
VAWAKERAESPERGGNDDAAAEKEAAPTILETATFRHFRKRI